ncbi:MAG: hypothetical protein ACPGSB_03985 [Opitutales bacterium]
MLTDAEATAIVEAQEEAKVARYQARVAELSSVEIVSSRTVEHEGHQMIINAIKPLAWVTPDETEPEAEETDSNPVPVTFTEPQTYIPEMISIGGNVYGDEHSKITWRDPETGASFIVWSNISLSFLSPISGFQHGAYDYSYFGFTTVYTREMDAQRAALAAEHGVEVEPLWEEPPVSFTEGQYEYYVEADATTVIPDKLHRQLSALFGYYLANKESLEVRHLNSKKLAEKRAEYLEANPPEPQPTVINFWKIEN